MPAAGISSKQPDEGSKPGAVDPRDAQIAELKKELAAARRSGPVAAVDGPPVRLKVEPPHSELHYAGRIIGTEFTEVPARMAAAVMEAADSAGVTLTQDLEG